VSNPALTRCKSLSDDGLFEELKGFEKAGDGVVAGFVSVEGRKVAVYAHDPTFMGGSLGSAEVEKITQLYRLALRQGVPVVGLSDSSGARIQEGPRSLAAVGEFFHAVHEVVGKIPTVTVVVGGCVGGAAYSAAMGDFVIGCVDRGYMFINGPKAVKHLTGIDVTVKELGGVEILARKNGVIDLLAPDEHEAVKLVRKVLGYLPQNHTELPPAHPTDDPRDRPCRLSLGEAYDVRAVVSEVFDKDSVLELKPEYAPNIFIGLARLGGLPVGVVANQPLHMRGLVDMHAARKVSRFIRMCGSFNIPLATFVDTAGLAPGPEHEHGGLVQATSKIFKAYLEARVPKVSIILGRVYGGAYIAMASKSLAADYVIGLERSEVAVLQPELSAEIIYRKHLEGLPAERRAEMLKNYTEELRGQFSGKALQAMGVVDTVVEPEELRKNLAKSIGVLFDNYAKNVTADRRPQRSV